MLPAMTAAFASITCKADGTQYIDHTELCHQLVVKKMNGADGRLLSGRAQFENPSCARRPARLKELMDAGWELRTIQLSGSGFASHRPKS